MKKYQIMIVAGEPSGEAHAAKVGITIKANKSAV